MCRQKERHVRKHRGPELQVDRELTGELRGDCRGGAQHWAAGATDSVVKVSKGFAGHVLSALKGQWHPDLLTCFWQWRVD